MGLVEGELFLGLLFLLAAAVEEEGEDCKGDDNEGDSDGGADRGA